MSTREPVDSMLLCLLHEPDVGELRAACLAAKWPPAEKNGRVSSVTGVSGDLLSVALSARPPRPDSRSTTSLSRRGARVHLGRLRDHRLTVKSRSTRSRPAGPSAGAVRDRRGGTRWRPPAPARPLPATRATPFVSDDVPVAGHVVAITARSDAIASSGAQRKPLLRGGGHVEVAARVQICRPGDLAVKDDHADLQLGAPPFDPGFLRSLTGQQEHDIRTPPSRRWRERPRALRVS